jgi:hypothetical protein
VELNGITEISAWLDEPTYQRVVAAARECGRDRLKPLFEKLHEQVDYNLIRLALFRLKQEESLAELTAVAPGPTGALAST